MYGAMLPDGCAGVDGDNLPARESLCYDVFCLGVVLWLTVCRHQDSSVDDEEVGVCGGQPFAIVIDWRGRW